ncbi:MAG: ABC transporter ATP-binding protein [Acidimicrobiales bacterium]
MSERFEIRGLAVSRGAAEIVHDIDLDVVPGEITVLLGPNGAGKTTLLEALAGVIPATRGTVRCGSTDVLGLSRPRRAKLGLSLVEQGRTIFPDLTVHENLLVAARPDAVDLAYEVFPRLAGMTDRRSVLLSGGEQQMLVIARALVARPRILMLDEMSLGLAPVIVQQLLVAARQLADDGLGILLVEQFANLALGIGDRAAVLSHGTLAYSGGCETLRSEPDRLHELYLGTPSGAG